MIYCVKAWFTDIKTLASYWYMIFIIFCITKMRFMKMILILSWSINIMHWDIFRHHHFYLNNLLSNTEHSLNFILNSSFVIDIQILRQFFIYLLCFDLSYVLFFREIKKKMKNANWAIFDISLTIKFILILDE